MAMRNGLTVAILFYPIYFLFYPIYFLFKQAARVHEASFFYTLIFL